MREKREGGGSGEIGMRTVTVVAVARGMTVSTSFSRINLSRI
jgi:hypothetical protein